MYRTFFYILVLVALIAVHSAFTWHRERSREDRQPWPRSTRAFLIVLAALCLGLIIAGVVVVIARLEPTASHALGGMALLMAVWFDFRLGRACGK